MCLVSSSICYIGMFPSAAQNVWLQSSACVEVAIIKCINCDCATKMFYIHAHLYKYSGFVLWNMYLNMYNQLIVDQNAVFTL